MFINIDIKVPVYIYIFFLQYKSNLFIYFVVYKNIFCILYLDMLLLRQ